MALSAGSDPIATYELYPVYLVEMERPLMPKTKGYMPISRMIFLS